MENELERINSVGPPVPQQFLALEHDINRDDVGEEEILEALEAEDEHGMNCQDGTHGTDAAVGGTESGAVEGEHGGEHTTNAGEHNSTQPNKAEALLCEICNQNPHRYKCPRCAAKTCSLACVKEHKATASCSGERAVAEAVPLHEMNDSHLRRDFQLLAGVRTIVDNAKRGFESIQRFSFHSLPVQLQALRNAAKKKGVICQILSEGMARRAANTSRYERAGDTITWRVTFDFVALDGELAAHLKELGAVLLSSRVGHNNSSKEANEEAVRTIKKRVLERLRELSDVYGGDKKHLSAPPIVLSLETNWGNERFLLRDIVEKACFSPNPRLKEYPIQNGFSRGPRQVVSGGDEGPMSSSATAKDGQLPPPPPPFAPPPPPPPPTFAPPPPPPPPPTLPPPPPISSLSSPHHPRQTLFSNPTATIETMGGHGDGDETATTRAEEKEGAHERRGGEKKQVRRITFAGSDSCSPPSSSSSSVSSREEADDDNEFSDIEEEDTVGTSFGVVKESSSSVTPSSSIVVFDDYDEEYDNDEERDYAQKIISGTGGKAEGPAAAADSQSQQGSFVLDDEAEADFASKHQDTADIMQKRVALREYLREISECQELASSRAAPHSSHSTASADETQEEEGYIEQLFSKLLFTFESANSSTSASVDGVVVGQNKQEDTTKANDVGYLNNNNNNECCPYAVLSPAERLPGLTRRYFLLNPSSTLHENLRTVFFVNEFPSLLVVPKVMLSCFHIVSEEERVVFRDTFRSKRAREEDAAAANAAADGGDEGGQAKLAVGRTEHNRNHNHSYNNNSYHNNSSGGQRGGYHRGGGRGRGHNGGGGYHQNQRFGGGRGRGGGGGGGGGPRGRGNRFVAQPYSYGGGSGGSN